MGLLLQFSIINWMPTVLWAVSEAAMTERWKLHYVLISMGSQYNERNVSEQIV